MLLINYSIALIKTARLLTPSFFFSFFFSAVGPIFLTRRDFSELPSSPLLSVALPTLRELSLRRLVLRPSSPTLPLESVSESSLSRTVRRSLPSSPTMVVLTLLMRTTRFSSPVSVERVRLRVISPVSDSRSSRSPVSPCLRSGSRRSRSPVLRFIVSLYMKRNDYKRLL